MGLKLAHLYAAPEVNPVNRKARAIPFFNPVNVYGRVFFFSWFGFMIAFWGKFLSFYYYLPGNSVLTFCALAWYTFPPLV